MASSEDKKKLLDVRLNESNPLSALHAAQQAHIHTSSHHAAPDREVASKQENTENLTPDMPQPAISDPVESSLPTEELTANAYPDAAVASDAAAAAELPDTRSKPRRIFDRVLYALSGVVPKRGDPPLEIVRKCVFVVALITLIGSLSYIFNDMVISPIHNQYQTDKVDSLYDPTNPVAPPADFTDYPNGILDSFKALYAENQDVRGYITYEDSQKSWLGIKYPVMYSGDNSYYLTHDFQKAKNTNGEPFFDYRNKIESVNSKNKVLVIYGHDMGSGQMFANLNKLLTSINYARTAPVINLDTLYVSGSQYKVFAVMLLNNNDADGQKFDYLRTDFSGDKDFMDYVANIRARSVYDYNDVDVQPDDDLLVLSTCSYPSLAKFKDSRCAVVARKVRGGESVAVDTSTILNNDDVIMPEAWYKNQGKDDHPYYSGNFTIPGLWSGSSDTASTVANTPTQQTEPVSAGTTVKGTAATTKSKTTSSSRNTPATEGSKPVESSTPTENTNPTETTPPESLTTAKPTETTPPETTSPPETEPPAQTTAAG